MSLIIINVETSAQILIRDKADLNNRHTHTHTLHISKYRSFLNLKWEYTMFTVLELVFFRTSLRQLVWISQSIILHDRFQISVMTKNPKVRRLCTLLGDDLPNKFLEGASLNAQVKF